MIRTALAAAGLLAAAACSPAPAPESTPAPSPGDATASAGSTGSMGATTSSERTMEGIIDRTILPHLDDYFGRIHAEQADLKIDGVPAFSPSDHFVGGKVISAMAYVLVRTDRQSPEFPRRVRMLREIVQFVSRQPGYETWNHLYAIKGLHRLERAGLLREVVPDSTMDVLKRQLDWRTFVDPTDLHLINLPTNYYGVAFGIAKYRELLGWDAPGNSDRILARLLDHVREYSGAEGFMDETPGDGRFDRYTVLIPAELAILLTGTETEVPPVIRTMLRHSSDIILQMANDRGHGFPYGRSIGLYGDLAPLQVLSIASHVGVLTAEEETAAYAYSTRIVQKYADFWIDPQMRSVNMWDHGRRTDEYRNKGRILGENLSTAMQIVEAAEDFQAGGMTGPASFPSLDRFLSTLPRYRLFRFASGQYERALLVARDRGHVIALPLISGARPYFDRTPYLPAPFETGAMEVPADTDVPHLVPRVTLADGRKLMPVVYMRGITTEQRGDSLILRVEQRALAVQGQSTPRPDSTVGSATTFVFAPGSIERRDELFFAESNLAEVEMEVLTSSTQPSARGATATFAAGPIASVEVLGLGDATVETLDGDRALGAPNGPLHARAKWRREGPAVRNSLHVGWRMTYR